MTAGVRALSSSSPVSTIIPSTARKVIHDLKEIINNTNVSDEEIYSVLRDCNMDPNETVQKLLNQGMLWRNRFFLRLVMWFDVLPLLFASQNRRWNAIGSHINLHILTVYFWFAEMLLLFTPRTSLQFWVSIAYLVMFFNIIWYVFWQIHFMRLSGRETRRKRWILIQIALFYTFSCIHAQDEKLVFRETC